VTPPERGEQSVSADREYPMTLLSLNLHREFFCAVLDGSKKIEYRIGKRCPPN
jgi:hypothetical protein